MRVYHDDGTTDFRYAIRREYCGYALPVWVVRFCGVWIGSSPVQSEALALATAHQEARFAVLEGRAAS